MSTTSAGAPDRSLEEKRGRYDFHRPAAREAALGLVLAPAPRPILLLSGEPGGGRGYFLEAVAHRAGEAGSRTVVLRLDLEGFEDGPAGLLRFLEHRQACRSEAAQSGTPVDGERLELLAKLAGRIPPSAAAAAVLSLLLEWKGSLQDVLHALGSDDLPSPERSPRENLRRLLAELSREVRLILHVESAQLDDVLRQVLLDEARRQGNLVLALSCHPRDADGAVAPRREVLRLEFERLTAADIHAALGVEVRPGAELGGGDRLVADRLRRFLDLAALCGENIPADLLFAHLGLGKEERDELLDRIDEELVEGGALRLFHDHQYDHPSFVGLLTYSFLSPLYTAALLDELAPHKRAPLAAELLGFLRQQIEVGTRGMAYLFLHLADELESDEERQRILLELGWWVSDDEAAVLAAKVAEDLDSDRLSSEAALSLVAEARDRWPPSRRLAVLEGIRQSRSGVPPPLAGSLDFLQAEALGVLSRPAEALPFAREAARLWESQAGPQSAPVGAATFLLGSLEYDLGQDLEAQTHLSSALSLLEAMPGQEQVIGALLVRLSHAYARQGRLEEADRDARRAVSWARQFFGDHDPRTAAALSAQAEIFLHRQEPGAALPLLEEALVIEREAYGERHPWNANLLGNLGVIHLQLGDLEQARQLLEESLALKLEIFGAESPDTQTTRQALEEVLSRLGGG